MINPDVEKMTIKVPEYSEWTCYLFGMSGGFSWKPLKGKQPNVFWRWMQYLCFGHCWIKDHDHE